MLYTYVSTTLNLYHQIRVYHVYVSIKYISVSRCQLAVMSVHSQKVKVNYTSGIWRCVHWIFWVAFSKHKITEQRIWYRVGSCRVETELYGSNFLKYSYFRVWY